jgi:hypothetical protein
LLKKVKLTDIALPTAFFAGISVRSDGEIVSGDSPAEVRIDELATPRTGVSVIGTQLLNAKWEGASKHALACCPALPWSMPALHCFTLQLFS